MEVLAGPGSALRAYGQLVAESKVRLERQARQGEEQPELQQAMTGKAADADQALHELYHKMRYAATLQTNLELRAQLLRSVLRSPELWPVGELTGAEQAQHRELIAQRDRMHAARRALGALVAKVDAKGAADNGGGAAADNGVGLGGGPREVAAVEASRVELEEQDAALMGLVAQLKEAKIVSDAALAHAHAQVAVD